MIEMDLIRGFGWLGMNIMSSNLKENDMDLILRATHTLIALYQERLLLSQFPKENNLRLIKISSAISDLEKHLIN